jgi:sugar phosphate isomerase/epimerase
MPVPTALQLWSVREDCASDFLGTIRQVAEMGYAGVEFAGFHGHEASAVAELLGSCGLQIAGAHTGWAALQPDNLEATLAFHAELGCRRLIVPGIPQEMRSTTDACLETADQFAALTDALRAEGFSCGYHCHEADMVPVEGGQRPWDLIAQHTPQDFVLQYDTSNGMHGGADPVQPLLDYPGRGTTVHLKEYSGRGGSAVVGEGQIPWADVLAACEGQAGTEWLIVEHEVYGDRTPLECARLCMTNLAALQAAQRS